MSQSLVAFEAMICRKREINKIHAGYVSLKWTQKRLHKESGVSPEQVRRFVKYKKVTLRSAMRFAIAISTALLLEGKHERYEDRQAADNTEPHTRDEARTTEEK